MKVVDNQGATWQVDAGLKTRAMQLQKVEAFQSSIEHVDVDQVMFVRLSNTKAKFMGKCYYIGKPPVNLLPRFTIGTLANKGLLDLNNVQGFDMDMFDIRFVIVMNDDIINMIHDNPEKVEDAVLVHELMHIHPSGEKLVKHDLEDFSALVDMYGAHWTQGIFDEENNPYVDHAEPESVRFEESS